MLGIWLSKTGKVKTLKNLMTLSAMLLLAGGTLLLLQ